MHYVDSSTGIVLIRTILFVFFVLLKSILPSQEIAEEIIAFDDFENSKNLLGVELIFAGGVRSNLIDPFTDFQDIFGITDGEVRVSSSLFDQPAPRVLIDRAANPICSGFSASDDIGVVACDYDNIFFGMSDVVNAQNNQEVSATWIFDIDGYQRLSKICIDIGAMGNFEQSDYWEITYSINGVENVLWRLEVNEDIEHLYNITNPTTLDDPLTINGNILSTGLKTYCLDFPPRTRGDTLILNLRGSMNGSDEAVALDNIIIYGFEVENPEGPAPNCFSSISASSDSNNSISITASQLVSNFDDNPDMVVYAEVFDDFGKLVASNLLNESRVLTVDSVCNLFGRALTFKISTDSGNCQGRIDIDVDKKLDLVSNLPQNNAWCFDFMAMEKPEADDLRWYRTKYPYTIKPTIIPSCAPESMNIDFNRLIDLNDDLKIDQTDSLLFVRETLSEVEDRFELQCVDWTIIKDCNDSDTLRIIYRTWQAFHNGHITSLTDTIVIFSLPEISDSQLICPAYDTIFSIQERISVSSLRTESICWKQSLPLHSEVHSIKYEKMLLDSLCSLYSSSGSDHRVKRYLDGLPLVKREEEELNVCSIIEKSLISADGKFYIFEYEIGDLILSDHNQYLEVDNSWFYSGSNQELEVSICLPFAEIIDSFYYIDAWDTSNCENVQSIVLPMYPNGLDLDTFCLVRLSEGGCIQYAQEDKDLDHLYCLNAKLRTITFSNACKRDSTFSCEQIRIYMDTIAPMIEIDSINTITTLHNSCFGRVQWPEVIAEDYHSGIKEVKARISEIGQMKYQRDSQNEDLWVPIDSSMMLMSIQEMSIMEIEVMDNCENVRTQLLPLTVEDDQAPTPTLRDKHTTMLEELVWFDARIFESEINDNCEVHQLMIRRLDYQDLFADVCDDELLLLLNEDGQVTTSNLMEVVEHIYENEAVAIRYRSFLNSLLTSDVEIDQLILQSWIEDLNSTISRRCNLVETANSRVNQSIGGGWSTHLPITCHDACEVVDIEVLASDLRANYSITSTTITPQVDAKINLIQELESIQLNCQTVFDNEYNSLFQTAVSLENNQNGFIAALIFSLLDEEFGRYFIVKDEDELDNNLGIGIDSTFTHNLLNCDSEADSPLKTIQVRQGIISAFCQQPNVIQEIKDNRNECGQGKLIRRWTISSNCGRVDDTLVLEQIIELLPACHISVDDIENIADTVICRTFTEDEYQSLEAPKLRSTITSCHSIGISHKDEIIRKSDQEVHIVRNIKIADWCSLQDTSITQVIRFDNDCSNSRSNAINLNIVDVKNSTQVHTLRNVEIQNANLHFESTQPNKLTIELFNVLGQLEYGATFDAILGHNRFDLSSRVNLSDGYYLVKISSDDFAYVERVTFFVNY